MENRAKQRGGLGRQIVSALIVAIGAAAVWFFLVGWVASLVASWMRDSNQVYENVTVTVEGTPVIQSYTIRDYENMSYRTLDGQPIEVKNNDQLQSAYLSPPVRPPGLFETPLGWGQTLGTTDYGRPKVGWYLIRDDEPLGKAYFAGFDQFSRMPIGFIGRKGFRRGLPPREEWFDVGRAAFGYRTAAATSGYLQYDAPAVQYSYSPNERGIPGWNVYLNDGNRLLEVDLRARSVRDILAAPELVGVGILTEAASASAQDPASEHEKLVERIAVRTGEQVIVLDPASGAKREFLLPESLRSENLSAYSIGGEQLLLVWAKDDELRRSTQHVMWLGADGKTVREEQVRLAQSASSVPNDRLAATLATGLLPVPIAWASLATVFAPLGMVQSNDVPTYAAGFAKFLDICWPAMIVVLVVGCLSAWVIWRWQRKYCRPASGAWCTFAFLLGLPGILAYWFEQHRPRLDRCGECRSMVPRDRDACAMCATPFPAPSLVGTEIFA